MPSVKQCLFRAQELESESPRLDVEVLLAWVLDKDRSFLYTWPEYELTQQQLVQFEVAFERRYAGEPIAYIVGQREFWSLPFFTDTSTLIPRPETELLVETALKLLPTEPCSILDLGTGTGAIAIALASERPNCRILAVDKNEQAVMLAKRNAAALGFANVEIRQSDWFDSIDERFSLIVSNPPYIDEDDEHLVMGDVRFEPRSALVATQSGLADIAQIVAQAKVFMEPNAWLLLEHGWQQREAVQDIFAQAGFEGIATVKDYAERDRVTFGQFSGRFKG